MGPVIWLSVSAASVVATCVIRFGNTRCAQALSWPPRPPATAASGAGRAAARARRPLQGRGIAACLRCVQLVPRPAPLPPGTPPAVGAVPGGQPGLAARDTAAV